MKNVIVELNNKDKSPLNKILLKKITKRTFEESGFSKFGKKKILISFANVSENEMKKLNFTYRNINKPTDVLSFPHENLRKKKSYFLNEDIFLGEIVICYNNIVKYAKKYKLNVKDEVHKVIVHGILHLLGFIHSKKMFDLQKKIKI